MTNRIIDLEGFMCSCHGTEHNITTDEATLRAALGQAQEQRHVCFVCHYGMAVSELKHLGRGIWRCADSVACIKRAARHEREK